MPISFDDKRVAGYGDVRAADKSTGNNHYNNTHAKTVELKHTLVKSPKTKKGSTGSSLTKRVKKRVGGGSVVESFPENIDEAGNIIKKHKNQEVRFMKDGDEVPEGAVKLEFALSSKQTEAMNATERYVMYGGAKGGGKSWFLCLWIFKKALQFAGNKLFFCRRRGVDFNNTTLETWKKCIPANMYRINEQKKKIFVLPTNSVIDYGGLDDPLLIQSLNSAEFAHIGVDQAEEIERDSFGMIQGTMRHQCTGLKDEDRQIILTANPAQCWLKDYFIGNPQPGTRYIPALPSDNPYLPKDYVGTLEQAFKHRPHLLQAYLYGSWDDLSGNDTCIRGSWIEEAKKIKPVSKVIKRIIVNDPAITGDENVCYLMEQAGNIRYRADKLILNHQRPIDTAAKLSAWRKQTKAQIIAVDCIGIGQGVIDQLNALEEPILAINSSSRPTTQTKQVRYLNLRAQMWWEAAELFADSKVALPSDDHELCSQLGAVKFEPSNNGKLQVEGKDDIKKRIGRSPDDADAFIMGLFALEYVNRLDQEEFEARVEDRVGMGELVPLLHDSEYVGVGEDYSGYNL